MESVGFASPAMVRTLLVPAAKLHRDDFMRHRACFQSVKDVRCVDLTSNPGIFNPQAYPQGRIFHNFVTKDEDEDTFFLHHFEPFRKTSIVIGIGVWENGMNDDTIRAMKGDMAKEYSSAITTALIIFNAPADISTKVADSYIVGVAPVNLETVVCDITSRFLANFSRYASAYEHTTLRSPGSLSGATSKVVPHSLLEKQRKRLTNSMETEKAKQNLDKGRKLKLSASFYLMVGNYKKALSDFSDAINLLFSANDHLWLASAFDGISICLFLLAYVGVPFQLPTFLTTIIDNGKTIEPSKLGFMSPKSSFQLSRSTTPRSSMVNLNLPDVPLATVADIVVKLSKLSLYHYHTASEYVPLVVMAESGLRNAYLAVLVGTEGALTRELMTAAIYGTDWQDCKVIKGALDLSYFSMLVSPINQTDFSSLSPLLRLKSYSVLIHLYMMVSMSRKACLMINQFIEVVITLKSYSIVNSFNFKELDNILEFYISTYGIRQTRDVALGEPNVLQLRAIYQAVELCSKISFHEGFIKYASIMLRDFHTFLIEDDQVALYEEIKHMMNETGITPQYWDVDMFVSFEIDERDKELIEGEVSDVYVTVNNPFAFPIEIQDYLLSTVDDFQLNLSINTNFPFVTPFKSIIIQAQETKRIPFLLLPQSNGVIKVDGLWATVCGCKREKFIVNKQAAVTTFKLKEKCASESLKTRQVAPAIPKIWDVKVVHKQPRLKLVNVELEEHVMLLEGEYREFKITLKNDSDVPINQLDLKFHDSTTDPLNTLLSKKDVPVNEVYELEYYLFVKKPFEILNKIDVNKIGPKETFHLNLKIWGKRGVTEAKLILDYANQMPKSLVKFKRELVVPVKISVYPSVELAGCDIIPVTANTTLSVTSDNMCVNYLKSMVAKGYELSDFCVLALDFMNMCPEQVEVTLQSLLQSSSDPKFQDGSGLLNTLTDIDFEYTLSLATRQNVRVFLPVKRVDLAEDQLLKSIPSLRNKQYVRDYKTPEAEQQFIRLSFWYRNEILNRLRATWKISDKARSSISAGRSGTIDIRSLKLSSKMLSFIEVDKLVISIDLLDNKGEPCNMSQITLSQVYTVRVTLINRNAYPVFGMIRHVVVCKNPPFTIDDKVLINGTLQFAIGQQLLPGTSRHFDLEAVFLERGSYEWGALFDLMELADGSALESLAIKRQFLQRQQLNFSVR